MYSLTKKEFKKLSKKGNLIPIFREILADMETPVSSFLKISQASDYAFLLESVEGQEKIARFSFLATNPSMIFKNKGRQIQIFKGNKLNGKKILLNKDPLDYIKDIMSQYRFVNVKGLPRFCGGMVGYIGYDTVRFFEKLPDKNPDDLNLPDILLILADNLLIFDHLNHKIKIVSLAYVDNKNSLNFAYQKAINKIEELANALKKPLKIREPIPRKKAFLKNRIISNLTKQQFYSNVVKAKKYIKQGDVIQVVLSQRFRTKLTSDSFSVYRRLRSINPSAYMYFLKFKDLTIVGSSPELLVRCEKEVVETRPIAGTRPRGKNELEDKKFERDLINDEKEKAEHIMLVDLGRNDLGRVCREGSVLVTEFMQIEKYSHVMHLVSNVKGYLKRGKDIFDVLRAVFPAGTVTGAPKVRSMEIIEELENVKRGAYAGCVGYFSFSGNLDTCITIRTIIIKNGTAFFQAGAGIVADSKPQKEYLETLNKAKALVCAITEVK
ncbi:MAG: anthranilate synthase component I [Candidatus Omnitrophota bacterium]|nr:anthranilate synthase component I [Candidatus Omnitrophota bacterium]